jgi:hypothetical protein
MSQRKIQWRSVDRDPKKLPTALLEEIIRHNSQWIAMQARALYDDRGSSANWEERQYGYLEPYALELERRKAEEERPVTLKEKFEHASKKPKKAPRRPIIHREDPPGLIARVDLAAKKKKMSRQQFINAALSAVLAEDEEAK